MVKGPPSEAGGAPWKLRDIMAATALVFVSFLVVGALFGLVSVGDEASFEPTLLTPWLLGAFEGLMVLAVWVFGVRKYRISWRSVGARAPEARSGELRRPLWSSVILVPLLALLVSLIAMSIYAAIVEALQIEILVPSDLPEDLLGSGMTRLLIGAVIVFWGPFAEEVFFRGFLLGGLIASLGEARAAVASAAVFAVAHLVVGSMIPLFITGLVLAWLYLRTKSIWPPLAAHSAQNLLALYFAP